MNTTDGDDDGDGAVETAKDSSATDDGVWRGRRLRQMMVCGDNDGTGGETRQPKDSSAPGDWWRPPMIVVARQWRTVVTTTALVERQPGRG